MAKDPRSPKEQRQSQREQSDEPRQSEQSSEPDATQHIPSNLLEQVEQRLAQNDTLAQHPSIIEGRMLLVCQHANDLHNAQPVQSVFEQSLAKAIGVEPAPPDASGMLLVYPQVSVSVVEACNGKLLNLVRELERNTSEAGTSVEAVKVASWTEDNTGRLLSRWIAAFCSEAERDWTELVEEDEENVVNTATTLARQVLELGKRLCELEDADLTRALQSIKTFEPPKVQDVATLVASEGAPTVQEFLDIYDAKPAFEPEEAMSHPILTPVEHS